MKTKMKLLVALVLMIAVCLTAAAALAVTTEADLLGAVAAGTDVQLTGDITATNAINFTKSMTLDLGGKKLQLTSGSPIKVKNGAVVKIIGGEIGIDNVVVGGNAIVEILGAKLTLENVKIQNEQPYSSEYGIFSLNNTAGAGTLTIDGCQFDLKNDTHTEGGVFKAEGGKLNSINILDSIINCDATQRVLQGGTVLIQGSAITSNAINLKGGYLADVTVDHSTIDLISGGSESRGLTLHGDSTFKLTKGSSLWVGDFGEAVLNFNSVYEKPIAVDNASKIGFHNPNQEDYLAHIQLPEDVVPTVVTRDGITYTTFTGANFPVEDEENKPVVGAAPHSAPRTGDSTPIAMLLCMMVLAGAGMMMLKRRSA